MRVDQVVQDARAGARILRTAPGLSAAAIVLVALVIGGNTTIYSIVHTILSRPAAGVADGDRLVTLALQAEGEPVEPAHSYPDYLDYAAQARTVRPMLGDMFEPMTLALDDGTYGVRGAAVTTNYFETLGVRLLRGRPFTDRESRLDGTGLVAVIGYRLWQDRFAGAADVVGRSILLNGRAATVVGVAPQGFRGPTLGAGSEVWVPLVAFSRAMGTDVRLAERQRGPVIVIGRLAPGATIAAARAEMATISSRLAGAFPETNAGRTVAVFPYSMTAGGNSVVAQRGNQFLAVFSVVTLLTLVIVCANVANLMVARVVGRQRELAVRLSLGASRARVIRLLLSEGLVLSLIAAVAACGFAWWVARAAPRFFTSDPASQVNLVDFSPDWNVVGYAMLLAVAGALTFTLAPALRVWRQELLPSLKPGEQGVAAGRSRLSATLAVVQIAFCVLLLTVAGLGVRALGLMDAVDLGFDTDRLLIVRVNAAGQTADRGQGLALLDRLRDRLVATPGVVGAATVGVVPPFGSRVSRVSSGAGAVATPAQNHVGPGFFALLGAPPIAGREFSVEDAQRRAPVAIVNQNLASRLWPRQSAVGQTLFYGDSRQPLEVAAVVPNALFNGSRLDTQPEFVFLPEHQRAQEGGRPTFYVRYRGALETVAPALRASLRQAFPAIAVEHITPFDTALGEAAMPVRFISRLLTVFAGGSLLVAAIGLYGVIAFNMRRRSREFGVRIALGASARQVLASVVREGSLLTGAGLVAGFALSMAVATLARGLLFGVTPTDPPTYAGVFALLACVSLLASYFPARRAACVDPVVALRQE